MEPVKGKPCPTCGAESLGSLDVDHPVGSCGPNAYAVCPVCNERIDLFHMKDFESYSAIEMQRHYQREHPEVLKGYRLGMPYTEVHFDG